MTDAGVIFRAGTTDEVGWLSQGGVQLSAPNDALRIALQTALGPRALRTKTKTVRAKKPPKR